MKTVAVACGAGSSSIFAAGAAGADAFVSGDSKHHELLAASSMGITMVDAVILQPKILQYSLYVTVCPKNFPQVRFIKSQQKDPVQYLV